MTHDELQQILRETLDDYRLSRSERQALSLRIDEVNLDEQLQDLCHRTAFELAREVIDPVNSPQVLEWLHDVTRVLRKSAPSNVAVRSEVLFSPADDCWQKIASMFKSARRSVDICVFTITDNRIADEIDAAHQRGVKVCIVTDNDKANDRGSDAERLARAGIEVRVDRTSFHMHHKFAIFDGTRLLTGSYNWTRSAAESNEENFLIADDRKLIADFQREFERLWKDCELYY
ncbi:MAG: phospholipase D-like domain-containing protein [Planctomycetota bacterium]|nr:phospholipase D-like domain-containing protein [Planctomycetota bacterium]MDA1252560.1 phospholipase D-like domain-containing protein [Planctomycetota bacterium]